MTRLLPLLLIALAAPVHAQSTQVPLTGRMLGGQTATSAPAPAAVDIHALPATSTAAATLEPAAVDTALPSARPVTVARAHPQVGDTTRSLLQLQASGAQGGRRLPILGDQATLSYARYLKSFEHEIPDFFENKVSSPSGSSSGN